MSVPEMFAQVRALLESPAPCVVWAFDDEADAGPWDSQMGGPGWGVPGAEVPRDAFGAPLLFVAQLAVADLVPALGPTALGDGVVQLFLAADPMACAFPSVGNGPGFVLRHIPAGTIVEVLPLAAPWESFQWEESDVLPRRLRVGPGRVWPSVEDASIQGRIRSIHESVRASGFAGQMWEHPEVSAGMDMLYEVRPRVPPIHSGGFPGFTQGDPRVRHPELAGHTGVWLNISAGPDLMVGDAGELHILLRPEDWAAGVLSNAIYDWDCP